MSWKDLKIELLEHFGAASHTRGHTRNSRFQAASASRTFESGELSTGHRGGLVSSKKERAAERVEFSDIYRKNWEARARARVVDRPRCVVCGKEFPRSACGRPQQASCRLLGKRCRYLATHPERLIWLGDESDTLPGWAQRIGLSASAIRRRIFTVSKASGSGARAYSAGDTAPDKPVAGRLRLK